MADNNFDVIVVGGGPGGYVAAIRASQLKLKTALVEREHLGGICLNWGCIPTKALLRSSEIHHLFERAGDFGFEVKDVSFDVKKVVARSRGVADQMKKGVGYLMKKNNVTVFDGHGALDGTAGALRKLKVTKDGKVVAELTAKHVILATGARARTMPGLEARRQAGVDLQGSHGARRHAEVAAGRRLGRHRHRVRELLQRHGRRRDGGRSARPRVAGGGRGYLRLRPQVVREAGHDDPHRRRR